MCQLLESILYQKGKMPLLSLHLDRMNKSRRECLHIHTPISLPKSLEPPAHLVGEKLKLRLLYRREIEQIEWIPYRKASVNRIKALEVPGIEYSHKYADRCHFQLLKKQHKEWDDILILKNGLLTDTTYCNILLHIYGQWLSPEIPLLAGVRRQFLLNKGRITAAPLDQNDLLRATEIRLINALMPMEDCISLTPEHVYFEQ